MSGHFQHRTSDGSQLDESTTVLHPHALVRRTLSYSTTYNRDLTSPALGLATPSRHGTDVSDIEIHQSESHVRILVYRMGI